MNVCHSRAMLLCLSHVSITGTGAEAGAYKKLFIHHIPWRVENCVGQTILAYG